MKVYIATLEKRRPNIKNPYQFIFDDKVSHQEAVLFIEEEVGCKLNEGLNKFGAILTSIELVESDLLMLQL